MWVFLCEGSSAVGFHRYFFLGELSNIVKHEMAKNRLLNDELMALKNATNMIHQIQTEASEHQARVDTIT